VINFAAVAVKLYSRYQKLQRTYLESMCVPFHSCLKISAPVVLIFGVISDNLQLLTENVFIH